MTNTNYCNNRYDIVCLFDVSYGNPNGDPNADNMPRIDPETGRPFMTDVCIKRKTRNLIEIEKAGEPGYEIFIRGDAPLQRKEKAVICDVAKIDLALSGKDAEKTFHEKLKEGKKNDPDLANAIMQAMCSKYYDVRTYGVVMTSPAKAGMNCSVRGAVQMGYAQAVDPVQPIEDAITRSAITTEKDFETKNNTFGRKYHLPYALFRLDIHVSPHLAKQTGFSGEDLKLYIHSLLNMLEYDRSATRGEMAMRDIFVFKHESEYGNAPAHKLADMVSVTRKEGVRAPRKYSDYEVNLIGDLPNGVTCTRLN